MAKPTKNGTTKRLETGMLSFARSLQPSEGLFWGTRSDDADWRQPIEVFEKGVRGQSSEFKTDNPGKSNPQVVEAAVVPPGCDGVRLGFSMLVLPHSKEPWACGDPEVTASYRDLVDAYADKGGFEHLARLYLWNIANGRFAWRNRFQADDMKVEVRFDGQTIVFNPTHPKLSLEVPASIEDLRASALSNEPPNVDKLVMWIAKGLREKRVALNVAWLASMQEGQEIFPSQEYLRGDQDELKKQRREGKIASRVYAKLPRFYDGREVKQASMHSQKIGAALRYIDSWHEADDRVIAINPYGGVQETGDVLRKKESKKDFYALRSKADELFSAIEAASNTEAIPGDVHFVVGNLVRGGVFGQKGGADA